MISSNNFAMDLCRTLEIDMKNIRSITIKLEVFKPVEIQIERFMSEVEGSQLIGKVASYVLIDKPEHD